MDIFDASDKLLPVMLVLLELLLPGTALYMGVAWLLEARHTRARQAAPLRAALLPGIGLSVAFWPLLLLYCSLLGLRFTPTMLYAVLLISLAIILTLSLTSKPPHPSPLTPHPSPLTPYALAAMTLLALAFRLGDIAGLVVPLFGDSLHHTMIASIITSTGQVPTGYAPYVPVDTFTYHFGFHTLAAVLAQLTGVSPATAVLVMGQALIVMALPVNYLLTNQLFNSRLAGLAAALITGFVSVMPAYYMNWGRYTQLAGLILLPVAVTLLMRAVQQREGAVNRVPKYETILAGLCVAGLVVVHYRILIFYGLFVVAMGVWFVVANRRNRAALVYALWQTAYAIVGGLLLTTPWIWNLAANYLPGLARRLQTVSPDYIASYNSFESLRIAVGLALAVLGAIGVAAAGLQAGLQAIHKRSNVQTFKRSSVVIGVAVWIGLMLLSMWVPPGAIGSLAVAIAMYIPLSALGGYGVAALADLLVTQFKMPKWTLPIAVPIALLIAAPVCALQFGTWRVVDVGTKSYVHDADLKAFQWIKENTPKTAKFLISSQISYAGRGVTASDAGMWLPLLADRQVSVPALSAWTERPLQTDFFPETRKLAAYTQPATDPETQKLVAKGSIPPPLGVDDPQMLAQMEKLGVTHVYSGAPGGASLPRLDVPAMRRDACHYKLMRPPEGGVYIFEVNYKCP